MISVILPVYNEETAIKQVIDSLIAELQWFPRYEVIVINDGSSDKSLDVIKQLEYDNLVIIDHIENLGYGKSLYDGIQLAKYECIAIIDGDGSYPVSAIKTLHEHYPQYDMIVGARSGREYVKGFFKRPARYLFKMLAEYATGRKIPDINSGLRIFKKSLVMEFRDSLCTGFSFTTTITLLFLLSHYFIKYIPVEYRERTGKSKVNHFKDTLRAAQIIIQAILYYNPIKLFLLLAAFNSVLGIALGVLDCCIIRSTYVAVTGSILTASFVPIFILGLMADQLKKIYKSKKDT